MPSAPFSPPRRIHAVHLLNDFSGSPLVFNIHLQSLHSQGNTVFLYTATPSGKGFLSDLSGISVRPLWYRWSPNRLLTLLWFLLAQAMLFLKIGWHARRGDLVYVNTLLPFGAMLAGRLRGAQVRVHVHEVSLSPRLLKRWLVWCTEHLAHEVIFVSAYVQGQYAFRRPAGRVVLNTLPEEFARQATAFVQQPSGVRDTVLMLCSLKAYKGIHEFMQIAALLPGIRFELVLNAGPEAVAEWVRSQPVPENCTVFPAQQHTHPFYQRARVVMNLSRPDEWIETFGMTVLEAMAYGAFVVVPPVGGPVEVIAGYPDAVAIDSRETAAIASILKRVFADSGNAQPRGN